MGFCGRSVMIESKTNQEYETIDLTPNWENMYRWFMNIKQTDLKEFKRILKKDKKDHNSEGLTRLIKMGKIKGWDKKYKQTY